MKGRPHPTLPGAGRDCAAGDGIGHSPSRSQAQTVALASVVAAAAGVPGGLPQRLSLRGRLPRSIFNPSPRRGG